MRWRTVGRVAVTALVGLLVPVAVAAVGIAGATGEIYTPRDASAPPVPVDIAAATYDRGKPTAVVVLGSEGANVADVLAQTLQYPGTSPQLAGPAWPWTLTLRPVLIAAAAVSGALIIQLLLRRRRGQIDADQVAKLGDETKSRQGGIDVTAGRS